MERKQISIRKLSLFIVSFTLMLQLIAGCASTATQDAGNTDSSTEVKREDQTAADVEVNEDIQSVIDEASDYIQSLDPLSDWGAYVLALAGKQVPDSYLQGVHAMLQENEGNFSKVTDIERIALALIVMGANPQDVAGYDLIDQIYNHEHMMNQGVNGPIYALLVLESGDYIVADSALWNEEKLISSLLEQQSTDGGWAFAAGESNSIDVTAMALSALAPYQGQAAVNEAIAKAVDWLSEKQLASGGFNEFGENSESAAQTMIALTALGIDPAGAAFTKANGNVLSNLLTFRQGAGGFSHTKDAAVNGMATEQALYALIAYQRFTEGQPGIAGGPNTGYDSQETAVTAAPVEAFIHVEGPQSTIAAGKVTTAIALEGLEQLLHGENVPYNVENASFGKFVDSIDAIDAGLFGGYDGWMYSVLRDGVWIYPAVGIDEFQLENNDHLYVYYGGGETELIETILVLPEHPQADEAFTVQVEKSTWNWDDDKQDISPAAAVTVQIGEHMQVTNEQGIATFEMGLPQGKHEIVITGYSEGAAPTIVKNSATVTVKE